MKWILYKAQQAMTKKSSHGKRGPYLDAND